MSDQVTSVATTTPALLQYATAQFGQQPFLEEEGTTISFAEFEKLAHKVAAALMNIGVENGDRVAIWAPNVSEWVIAALGLQCAGAVLVPLNTRYKGSEAAYILKKSRAKVLFSIGNFLNTDYPAQLDGEDLPDLKEIVTFRSTDSSRTSWESFLESGAAISAEVVNERVASIKAEDLSDILFTSGTTGSPKGVMTGHEQNLQVFTSFSEVLGLIEGDRYLVINPFFHSFGYKAGILICLIRGATLLPHAVFDTEEILTRISQEKISVMPGPPTLFQSILAHPKLDQYDISSLKRATTGAAVIPVEMIEQMWDKLGFETVITAYGLTESCGVVTMCRQGDSAETIATTSGRAIPGIEVRCVDSDNKEVPLGEAGEIVFRGYNVMLGYFENEEATSETIDQDGWLHTGDIGVMDEQGNIKITDRLKDMFINGGFNCYPAEIEKIVAGHDAIAMNAVIGVPDERMGEVAMAFVVLKAGNELSEEDFVAWCRDKMANYKVPRKVRFVSELPLNASGKVVKPELKKMI